MHLSSSVMFKKSHVNESVGLEKQLFIQFEYVEEEFWIKQNEEKNFR